MHRLTVDDVYEHAHGICFKNGPPGTVGAETEWLVVDRRAPGAHVAVERLRTVVERAGPLPGGSAITFEPGGQLELSSAPFGDLGALHRALSADIEHVRARLAEHALELTGRGMDPARPPRLQADHPRYACMRDYFVATGYAEAGLTMMCSTASVQVCLEVGADPADAQARWRLAHALGPVLVAAFANSPLRAGRPTGLRSTRQATWSVLDPARTLPVASGPGADPAADWARYALDARVMLVRPRPGTGERWAGAPGMTFRQWLAKGEPDRDDLAYHLTTLFPPVRPRGWLELRMIDAPPLRYWPVPVAVAAALLDDPRAADAAAEATAPVAGRWAEAARDALTDPALARAARACFTAALEALPRLGAAELTPLVAEYADRYVDRGRCPADDLDPAHLLEATP
ncbi:ergothioneine biosynthesis glutamate--cysteine ligase EgtA [Thermomonospora catenispora]|uniref:ergothioneine biosynthesis glutamate--cysteine ligase EgtA n=1 Tax=Thermomonospora catenispora TaxID=2493090 RepID=UPI00111D3BF7|nr:ergothioneine biosynthesis glutamate--cysteine ligase EgtA [Thermomonospora catenispora]TNY38518.1 ergothioneine biosynthesis glutamate--cysteine ligase EgtA [Thermomonospora catenispora]